MVSKMPGSIAVARKLALVIALMMACAAILYSLWFQGVETSSWATAGRDIGRSKNVQLGKPSSLIAPHTNLTYTAFLYIPFESVGSDLVAQSCLRKHHPSRRKLL